MSYPQFIAIDASSYEEEAHPIAIAWSMADGRIKTTLIQPDDDWDDWDMALEDIHGISQDTLYQRGETCWSIVRELENDLNQGYLMTDDEERCAELLEKVFEVCNRDSSVEVGSLLEELTNQDLKAQTIQHLFHEHLACDDRVLVMLKAWTEENGHPAPEEQDAQDDNEESEEDEQDL